MAEIEEGPVQSLVLVGDDVLIGSDSRLKFTFVYTYKTVQSVVDLSVHRDPS